MDRAGSCAKFHKNGWNSKKNIQCRRSKIRMERKKAWKAVTIGVVRLNVSLESVGKGKGTSVGIVVRNHSGELLQTWSVF